MAEEKTVRVVVAHEQVPMSKTEKVLTFIGFVLMVWSSLPPRKRRG